MSGNAWSDLIEALEIMSLKAPNVVSPLHCEHDVLTVMVDPNAFSKDELDRLDTLGFFVGNEWGEEQMISYRYGSA